MIGPFDIIASHSVRRCHVGTVPLDNLKDLLNGLLMIELSELS